MLFLKMKPQSPLKKNRLFIPIFFVFVKITAEQLKVAYGCRGSYREQQKIFKVKTVKILNMCVVAL